MSYYMMSGLGAIDFNAASVWSDWLAGANGNAAAGKQAASNVQAALNQLGYGPLTVDGVFGAGSLRAWARFANDNGTGDAKWPTQVGIDKLGEVLAGGGAPGGGPIIESHVVNGQFVPGAAPGSAPIGSAKAGMTGTQIGMIVAALAVVGGLAYMAKKKKASGSVPPSHAGFTDLAVRQVPNRRHHRRHHHARA